MYVDSTTGLNEYESFEELLDADVDSITEDKKNYYVMLKPEQTYDCTVWVVNKRTRRVSFMHYIQYAYSVMDYVTSVNIESIKRAD